MAFGGTGVVRSQVRAFFERPLLALASLRALPKLVAGRHVCVLARKTLLAERAQHHVFLDSRGSSVARAHCHRSSLIIERFNQFVAHADPAGPRGQLHHFVLDFCGQHVGHVLDRRADDALLLVQQLPSQRVVQLAERAPVVHAPPARALRPRASGRGRGKQRPRRVVQERVCVVVGFQLCAARRHRRPPGGQREQPPLFRLRVPHTQRRRSGSA